MKIEFEEDAAPSPLLEWLVEHIHREVHAQGNTPAVRGMINLLARKIRSTAEADYVVGALDFLRETLPVDSRDGQSDRGPIRTLTRRQLIRRAARAIANQRERPCWIRLNFPHQPPRRRSSTAGCYFIKNTQSGFI